jgi:glycine/D-amino acid oxidase-like deaminating enzyme
MRIAVLGGGFQGCCTAIELAIRGAQVCLYDRNAALLSGAATANEGKIHLGYVYGGDRSLATARMMLAGSLPFAALVQRFLDAEAPFEIASRYVYAVHRTSLYSADEMAAYYEAVHGVITAAKDRYDYFGIDLEAPRRLSAAERDDLFNGANVVAAFATDEIAIDSVALAAKVQARVAHDAKIDVRLGRRVVAVEGDGDRLTVRSTGAAGDQNDDVFDGVVNALWDGRLAIDATRGQHPGRKWVHRNKHGIRFRSAIALPSITVALGPYGDIVNYGNGGYHLSWYPVCMTEHSDALAPPRWPEFPDEPRRSQMVEAAFAAMAAIVPKLAEAHPTDVAVKGGVIFAWGATDIDDPDSELHQRYRIGVQTQGRYHSINTGKLTMAPHFAEVCANRILPK